MSTASTASTADAASWRRFDTTTSRWGRITMLLGMVLMIAGPAVLAAELGVHLTTVLAAVATLAVAFGVIWVVEPLSYFPILGPASMYQAFMIGNISNKLLPAAIVAQSTIGARPDTRKGQLAAVLAICGAATTHLTSLAVCVGLLGTVLMRVIPDAVVGTVQLYVLPAIMGAILVQMVASNPDWRTLRVAVAVGVLVQFVLVPLVPAIAPFALAVAVLGTTGLVLASAVRRAPAASENGAPA
ncbi:hypothetical protein ACQFYA_14760 [Promicromonospora sp. Marseille-Q5078]